MSAKLTTIAGLTALACSVPGASLVAQDAPKVTMTVRVSPTVAFSPARIVATADLRNVRQDDPLLYCPTVEWDWGDGTESVESSDCDPFEPGVSQVKIRYVKQNTYHASGRYRVTLRLKRDKKVLVAGSTSIVVRASAYEGPPPE
jgi:hypothetical protein